MVEPVHNRRPCELSEREVEEAIARIGAQDVDAGRGAADVYESLTRGEGPGVIRLAAVQDWLWYRVPTKYITDEDGYMGRLAADAAELFDELGLDTYAAVCRSEVTSGVHAAYERSDSAGFKAMREAMERSGVDPPDLDDFVWGEVMGIEESMARSAAEDALEAAIASGELVVGGRGRRARQREITEGVLDSDHPGQPGQSWRTAVITERIGVWVEGTSRRSEQLGRMRGDVANQLLHPIDPPGDVKERMAPALWLLGVFGDEQPLTQAGYLNRAFVQRVHAEARWSDPFRSPSPPRSETDEVVLHRLRGWIESAGAVAKRGKKLRRTRRGAAMVDNPVEVWEALVAGIGADRWDRFVIETAGLVLVDRGEVPAAALFATVAQAAADLGWRTTVDGVREAPSERDVSRAFYPIWGLFEVFGFAEESGDWRNRRFALSPSGETTMLAMIRHSAAGPRVDPW